MPFKSSHVCSPKCRSLNSAGHMSQVCMNVLQVACLHRRHHLRSRRACDPPCCWRVHPPALPQADAGHSGQQPPPPCLPLMLPEAGGVHRAHLLLPLHLKASGFRAGSDVLPTANDSGFQPLPALDLAALDNVRTIDKGHVVHLRRARRRAGQVGCKSGQAWCDDCSVCP